MKQTIITLCGALLLLFQSSYISAQDKKIAMLEPIAVTDGMSIIVKNMVRGELTKSLGREEGYYAFTRLDIDKLMKEHNFQESGMVSDEQRLKLGQMTGADYVCISKITQEDDAYYIEASLVHVESGRIDNPGTAFAKGDIENVNKACKVVAADMLGKKIAIEEPVVSTKGNSKAVPKKSAYPKVVYNDNFKISILSLVRKGNSAELIFTVKNEGSRSQYFSCIGYNGWEFKLYTNTGDVIVASKQPEYYIGEEVPSGLTLKRRVMFNNVPDNVHSFSHLIFKSRPAYTGHTGLLTHSIKNLPIQND